MKNEVEVKIKKKNIFSDTQQVRTARCKLPFFRIDSGSPVI